VELVPNVGRQLLPEAGATQERTLEAVRLQSTRESLPPSLLQNRA
jgi:hypothetical protein